MRLMTWNVGHAARERSIPPEMAAAVTRLAPEVIVLTEYVHGRDSKRFEAELHDGGWTHITVTKRIPGQNQLLLASRRQHALGDLMPPVRDGCAEANFMHAVLPEVGIEIVGVRVPAYVQAAARRQYWQRFGATVRSAKHRRIVFLGDLNTDPDTRRDEGAMVLQALRTDGWQIPTPSGDWSFFSKREGIMSRIDHVVVGESLARPSARYVAELDGIVLAGPPRVRPLSDHAPLIVDLSV